MKKLIGRSVRQREPGQPSVACDKEHKLLHVQHDSVDCVTGSQSSSRSAAVMRKKLVRSRPKRDGHVERMEYEQLAKRGDAQKVERKGCEEDRECDGTTQREI